jgi:hypothetical protein
MKSSGDAVAAVCERAAIVSAKMAGADDRSATRNVRGATQRYAATHIVNSPSAEAPAEAAKGSQADRHAEAESDHADGHWRHHEGRIRGHEADAKYRPGIVNRNGNQQWIDRHNRDRAFFNHHSLLRRRHQYFRRLRLEPASLDGVHHVFRLVVIGVAQLCFPARVLCQILEDCRKLRQAFHSRVPSHVVHGGRALIDWHRNVRDRPRLRRGYLIRKGGGCQYLSHQRIRIECDRGHQLIQLVGIQSDVVCRRWLLRVDIQLRCIRNQQRGKRHRQQLARGLKKKIFALRDHRCWVLFPS